MADMVSLNTKKLTITALFVALIVGIPFLGLPQPITGSLVNLMFVVCLVVVGLKEAFILAFMPSVIALIRGIIPPIMLPFIPFIIAGNIIYIVVQFFVYKRFEGNGLLCYAGIILSALLKSAFLFASATFIFAFPQKVAYIMGIPQFITATVGGVLGYTLGLMLRKRIFV